MRNAIELLLRFGYHLLFISMEFLCFYIIINYNHEQKTIFLNSTNILSTSIDSRVDKFNQYLRLEQENDSLHLQNARLIEKFIDYDLNASLYANDTLVLDSSKYHLVAVEICNSTFNLRDNYLTLCKGSSDGIVPDMGVVSQNGIVGIVKKVSPNFSIVMSILHSQSTISCLIKRNNSNGTLTWKSTNPKLLNLEAVPKHKSVFVGDTVITSGYSTIFPKGIMVGKVKSVVLEAGNNSYTIEVDLFNDPSAWDATYVIFNNLAGEQRGLEASITENE
ncbi:MAG: rod shape-determining protein MreC [Saprospiraceae bacterium]|nr:rod shape-determining protein MreC [Saprospiraceae bacterium]